MSHKLSKDQEYAVKEIATNKRRNLFFLTGRAGTGKSFIIHHLKGQKKKVAPTGVAAQLIGGTTVHRFLGLRPGSKYASPRKFWERTEGYDYLIIDEISMVGYKIFDIFMIAYRDSGFAGKVIFVGDFKQLPPVKDEFCFKHHEWKNVKMLQLTTVHRQSSLRFLGVLNNLREGRYTKAVDRFIYNRTIEEKEIDGSVKLASLRKTVDDINNRHLNELVEEGNDLYEMPSTIIRSKTISMQQAEEEVDRNARLPRNLRLCEGARVVMLTNTDHWCNGTSGVISEITEDSINVLDDNGYHHIGVEKHDEEIRDGDEKLILTNRQFPMMLAFALTIHKSQGMTLDKVHIDLDNHFAPGQTYVSVSRCTNPSGVTFSGDLKYLTPVDGVPHD